MTRQIDISRARFSRLAWEAILNNSVTYEYRRRGLFQIGEGLEILRGKADYNTGSISNSSMWCIASVTRYFEPKVVAEVGTFIGKSTNAMAWAMHDYGGKFIFTCDHSNDIELPKFEASSNCFIRQFPKTTSTNMFNYLVNTNTKADMILLDGRLTSDDIEVLPYVVHDDTVIVLDDFEGTEKGVVNALNVMTQLKPVTHKLIYSPEPDLLAKHGLDDRCSIGLIIPNKLIGWTNQ